MARGAAPDGLKMGTPDDRLMQRSGVDVRRYDKGAMLVDMATGRCYRLNPVGAEIWALLQRPVGVADVCAELSKKYPLAADTLERDVRALVADLITETLVQTVPAEAAP